jgi:CheY-like chemotaxis protein
VAAYLTKPIRQSDLLNAVLTVLSAPARQPERSPPPGHRLLGSKTAPRRLRLLLAEDNAINQKLALRLLEKRGHAVTVVSTGKEALAALAEQRFDAVLMDVQMPEMDGFEATAAIRARERETGGHVPIIAMTAHAMKGDRELCLAAGMDGYISKPLQASELFEAIEGPPLEGTPAPSPR